MVVQVVIFTTDVLGIAEAVKGADGVSIVLVRVPPNGDKLEPLERAWPMMWSYLHGARTVRKPG